MVENEDSINSQSIIPIGSNVLVRVGNSIEITKKILAEIDHKRNVLAKHSTVTMSLANAQHTSYYDTNGINKLKGLKWKLETEGIYSSSPIVINEVVYITGSHSVNAIDCNTGKIIWTFEAYSWLPTSPAIMEGVIYFSDEIGDFYALYCHSGLLKWHRKSSGHKSIASSHPPTVLNGIVYYSFNNSLYAIDSQTGNINWEFNTSNNFESSPAILDKLVYCGGGDGLYAVDHITGKLKWKFITKDIVYCCAIMEDLVYFDSGDYLYAVKRETGNLSWKFRANTSSVAIMNGIIYFTDYCFHKDTNDSLYALDCKTGKLIWKLMIGREECPIDPITTDNIVYFGAENNFLCAADCLTGEILWKFKNEYRIKSEPVIKDRVIYFRSVAYGNNYLYAVE